MSAKIIAFFLALTFCLNSTFAGYENTDDRRPDNAAAPTGPTGPAGPIGPPGARGAQGADGPSVGVTGPAGCTGPQGFTGPTGPAGTVGNIGPQGMAGATGLPGLKGDTGLSSRHFCSLIFNATSIHNYQAMGPESYVSLPSQPMDTMVQAWAMRPPPVFSSDFLVSFNVPHDFIPSNRTEISVHFVTNDTGISRDSTVELQLDYLFTGGRLIQSAEGLSAFPPVVVEKVIGSAAPNLRHYMAVFPVTENVDIVAGAHAILNVTRLDRTSRPYTGDIFLTSIEFRYLSSGKENHEF